MELINKDNDLYIEENKIKFINEFNERVQFYKLSLSHNNLVIDYSNEYKTTKFSKDLNDYLKELYRSSLWDGIRKNWSIYIKQDPNDLLKTISDKLLELDKIDIEEKKSFDAKSEDIDYLGLNYKNNDVNIYFNTEKDMFIVDLLTFSNAYSDIKNLGINFIYDKNKETNKNSLSISKMNYDKLKLYIEQCKKISDEYKDNVKNLELIELENSLCFNKENILKFAINYDYENKYYLLSLSGVPARNIYNKEISHLSFDYYGNNIWYENDIYNKFKKSSEKINKRNVYIVPLDKREELLEIRNAALSYINEFDISTRELKSKTISNLEGIKNFQGITVFLNKEDNEFCLYYNYSRGKLYYYELTIDEYMKFAYDEENVFNSGVNRDNKYSMFFYMYRDNLNMEERKRVYQIEEEKIILYKEMNKDKIINQSLTETKKRSKNKL